MDQHPRERFLAPRKNGQHADSSPGLQPTGPTAKPIPHHQILPDTPNNQLFASPLGHCVLFIFLIFFWSAAAKNESVAAIPLTPPCWRGTPRRDPRARHRVLRPFSSDFTANLQRDRVEKEKSSKVPAVKWGSLMDFHERHADAAQNAMFCYAIAWDKSVRWKMNQSQHKINSFFPFILIIIFTPPFCTNDKNSWIIVGSPCNP